MKLNSVEVRKYRRSPEVLRVRKSGSLEVERTTRIYLKYMMIFSVIFN